LPNNQRRYHMKKSKLKQLIKEARKSAKKSIEQSIIAQLKEETIKLGHTSKKLEREIVKGSKQLAKKLAREFKIDAAAISQTTQVIKDVKVPEVAQEVSVVNPAIATPKLKGSLK
jgi:predicted transcriptional regulator